ncbi:MAG: hypothetical protein E3J94_04915 [Desulfobacteraceae bacterium]|nr:MAG: hypothetical protein E3J94_04915 [Desulfobacteraceae bacterium]
MISKNIVNYTKGWKDLDGDKFTLQQGFVYRGEVGKVLLGEAVDRGDTLYPVITSLGTVAEWKQSNANLASTMPVKAMALEAGGDGSVIKVLFRGYVKDTDFSYDTRATGTVVISGTVTEGDRLVIDDTCFMMTALTAFGAKLKATTTLSTTGIGVNAETITIGGVVFECSTDGTIEDSSDYMIDLQAGTAQGLFETAIQAALDQAIAAGRLDISYVDFTGNDLVITLGGKSDSYVGLEQNLVVSTETCTNASFAAVTFLGGVPKVDYLVTGAGATLTIAEIKTALTAALVQAIADGNVDITQAAWATNDLVLTAGAVTHKGYGGNSITMYECDAAGTKDAGGNTTVSAAKFSGGVEGGKLYAAGSKGLKTLTKPANCVTQEIGFALEADKFFFNPQGTNEDDLVLPAEHGVGAIGSNFAPRTTRRTVGGVIVTQIKIDLTGLKQKGDVADDVVGLADASDAYIGRYVVAKYGVVFKVEIACIELPASSGTETTDMNLTVNSDGTLGYDEACSNDYLFNTGALVLNQMLQNLDPNTLTANDYIYITEGDTTASAATLNAGMYIVTFYGHPVLA